MSAFIVDQYHIDQLVSTGLRGAEGNIRQRHAGPLTWYYGNPTQLGKLDSSTADRVGQMLWAENFASVQYRYPTDTPETLPGPIGITPAYATFYTYTQPRRRLTAVEAFKAIACYEYQSCEHPGWETSEARAFCRALEHAIIRSLPGWDDAAGWGLSVDFDTPPTPLIRAVVPTVPTTPEPAPTPTQYISVTDTAKLLREALKKAFPAVKFSVRSDKYAGGASIDVYWTDGPTAEEVEAIAKQYEGADFDGMQDLKTYKHTVVNGQRVHYGADYIFSHRTETPADAAIRAEIERLKAENARLSNRR